MKISLFLNRHLPNIAKSLLLAFLMLSWQGLSAQTDTIAATPLQPATQVAQPQAIILGKVTSASIIPLMPQYQAMQNNMVSLREQYEAEAKKSESDFQRKFEEFMKGQKDFPQTILEKRQNELQAMLETNAAFRIKVQALLKEAETAMMADVKAELSEAISLAAQQKGVSVVFDLDGDGVPYLAPNLALDLNADVRIILGIDPAPNN